VPLTIEDPCHKGEGNLRSHNGILFQCPLTPQYDNKNLVYAPGEARRLHGEEKPGEARRLRVEEESGEADAIPVIQVYVSVDNEIIST